MDAFARDPLTHDELIYATEASLFAVRKALAAGEWLEIAAVQIDSIDPAFPGPLIGPYDPDVRDVIDDAHDSFMLDGGTPQDALDRAQAEIDELLEAYASF